MTQSHQTEALLAVDLGIRTGLALFGRDGRLLWHSSRNFGNRTRLKRGAQSVLNGLPNLAELICEGGGNLATIWEREAARRNIPCLTIDARTWRERLLLPRDRRCGQTAKKRSLVLARSIVDWSGAGRATTLRHDAAEAILIGYWAVLHFGWLVDTPPVPDVQRNS